VVHGFQNAKPENLARRPEPRLPYVCSLTRPGSHRRPTKRPRPKEPLYPKSLQTGSTRHQPGSRSRWAAIRAAPSGEPLAPVGTASGDDNCKSQGRRFAPEVDAPMSDNLSAFSRPVGGAGLSSLTPAAADSRTSPAAVSRADRQLPGGFRPARVGPGF